MKRFFGAMGAIVLVLICLSAFFYACMYAGLFNENEHCIPMRLYFCLTAVLLVAGIVMLFVKRSWWWGGLLAAWFFFSPLVMLRKIRANTYKRSWLSIPLMFFSPISAVLLAGCFLLLALYAMTAIYSPKTTSEGGNFEEYRTSEFITELTSIPFPAVELVDSAETFNWGESYIQMRYKTKAPFSRDFIRRIENDSNWRKEGSRLEFSQTGDSIGIWTVVIYPDKDQIDVTCWWR